MQVVRTAVEAAIRPPATVGLVGLEASDNDVQAFAADLAAALAVAGRQVLLIDANTQRPARYVEFDNESPRFADIVGSSSAAIEDTQAIMKAALNDRTEVVPGLRSLAAGKNVGDPVDNLAGRSFLTLLDVARDLADVTIFATPAFGEPTTEVMTHRLDFMVVVARIRATTTHQLEHTVESMAGRSADVLGVVLLHGKKSLTGRSPKAIRPSSQRGNRREKRHTRKPPPSGPVPSSPSDHPHKRGEPEEPAGHDATEDPTGPPAGIQTPAAVASDNTAGPGAAPDLVARSGASSIKPSSDAAETKKPRAGKRARRKIQSSPTESIESGSGKHRSPQARAAATRRPAAVASREDPTDNAELSEPKESPAPVGERQKQPSGPAGSDLAGDTSSTQAQARSDETRPSRTGRRTSTSNRDPVSSDTTPVVTATKSQLSIVIDDRDGLQDTGLEEADLALVEEYLEKQVLAIVGVGGGSAQHSGFVDPEGIVPITPVSGTLTVGERLAQILQPDASSRSLSLDRALNTVFGKDLQPVQRWITNRFFAYHMDSSQGRPSVWHLSSAAGTFQVLVAADEFDDNRLQLLRAHDVRRTIVGIRHRINNEAGENGIRRTALQSSIDDVREFDRALANLGRTGWRDESQTRREGGIGGTQPFRHPGSFRGCGQQ